MKSRELKALALAIAFATVGAVLTQMEFTAQPRNAAVAAQPVVEGDKPGLEPFDFALIGDTRYTTEQQNKFPNMIDDINQRKLAFVVHDGDIKAGSNACVNTIYTETIALFNQFKEPLIYTPGDNEWTDCHRAGGDSLERLSYLRGLFFADDLSLGQRKMRLERQSAAYPENARWGRSAATFATVHVVGSNNNLGRNAANDAEYAARNAANVEWIKSTFTKAVNDGSLGVMLIMQADPWDGTPATLTGYVDTLATLQSESIKFGKPVILVHGDSHFFRIDKPLTDKAGQRLERFTRVETFGTEDVHWVRVTVDPREPELFVFRQEIVDANLDVHQP